MDDAAGEDTIKKRHHEILWSVRRSIRYHTRRRDFFEGCNNASNAFALILGSGTILSVLKDSSGWSISLAALVTVFSTINLVFKTTIRAQNHHDLARRFIELEKFLVLDSPTDAMLQQANAKRLDIEADEPPILRVVDILSHNDLLRATGYDPISEASEYYEVSFFKRLLAPLFDISPDNIRRRSPKSSES